MTEIERRLTWLAPIVFVLGMGLAFTVAPAVDRRHSPDRLTNWFILVITVLAGFGGALLFFQRNKQNAGALRFLRAPAVAYVIFGVCAAVVGVLPLKDGVYRYLFALSVAALVAVLTTTVLVAVTSLSGQRKGAEDEGMNVVAEMQEQAKQKGRKERGEAGDR